jgi:hypothetical protein
MHDESGGAGGAEPGRPREPYRDPLDPRGSMGMPKILSRAAEKMGRGPRGGGSLAAGIYVLSVLAIIVAFAIFFLAGGH